MHALPDAAPIKSGWGGLLPHWVNKVMRALCRLARTFVLPTLRPYEIQSPCDSARGFW